PTATFCWVAPARTIAYTAVSFVVSVSSLLPPVLADRLRQSVGANTEKACCCTPRVHTTVPLPHAQNETVPVDVTCIIAPANPRVVPANLRVVPASPRVVPASPRVVPASPRVVPPSPRVVPHAERS